MYEFEDHYWWFVGRQAIVRALLDVHLEPRDSRRLLDIGCGSGATLRVLSEYGHSYGLDPAPLALKLCRERGLERLVTGDATQLPFEPDSLDLVTALDVLEHIEDDLAAAREVHRVLRPGGQFLLTVPAYQFLWSDHDRVLDHHRRYTTGQVGQLLRNAGFAVQRLTYCITFLLAPAIFIRLGERFRPRRTEPHCALVELPRPLNRFCLATLELEAKLLQRINLPCGVSLLAMAKRAD